MLPPSAAATAVAAFSSDGAKMNRGGSGAGRSVESLLEAVPPVTNGSLLGGGGGYGDELSTGCDLGFDMGRDRHFVALFWKFWLVISAIMHIALFQGEQLVSVGCGISQLYRKSLKYVRYQAKI